MTSVNGLANGKWHTDDNIYDTFMECVDTSPAEEYLCEVFRDVHTNNGTTIRLLNAANKILRHWRVELVATEVDVADEAMAHLKWKFERAIWVPHALEPDKYAIVQWDQTQDEYICEWFLKYESILEHLATAEEAYDWLVAAYEVACDIQHDLQKRIESLQK